MSELQPIIPRDDSSSGGGAVIQPQDTPEPVPITEQEVGEYREQDRFLPVRPVLCCFCGILTTRRVPRSRTCRAS